MPWTTITQGQVDARSPINETLMTSVRGNLVDLDDRVNTLEAYGNNWADQLGTAINDTNMGTLTSSFLPQNSNVKSIITTLGESLGLESGAAVDVSSEYGTTATTLTFIPIAQYEWTHRRNIPALRVEAKWDMRANVNDRPVYSRLAIRHRVVGTGVVLYEQFGPTKETPPGSSSYSTYTDSFLVNALLRYRLKEYSNLPSTILIGIQAQRNTGWSGSICYTKNHLVWFGA